MPTPSRAVASLHPWHRWLGRYLDYLLFTVIVAIGLNFIPVAQPILDSAFLLTFLAGMVWVPIEALWLTTIGTTPGKTLVGISVSSADGTFLTPPQALSRAMSAWITGCAMQVPLVSLITMSRQYTRLTEGHQAIWDERAAIRIVHTPLSVGRVLLLVGVIVLFLGLIALGQSAPS